MKFLNDPTPMLSQAQLLSVNWTDKHMPVFPITMLEIKSNPEQERQVRRSNVASSQFARLALSRAFIKWLTVCITIRQGHHINTVSRALMLCLGFEAG